MSTPSGSLEEIVRIEGGRVLASLIRLTGDIGLAEDSVQDAVLVALERWPLDGVPHNPAAWLTTVARNKALDRIRREARRHDRERVAVAAGTPFEERQRRLGIPEELPDGRCLRAGW